MCFRCSGADIEPPGTPEGRPTLLAIADHMIKSGFPTANLQTPTESVSAQLKVIDGLTLADNGKFLHHDGAEFPM